MRVKVEFPSLESVREFTAIVQGVDEDVRLIGKDENGNDWFISAKSFFCSVLLAARLQNRSHTAHEVDWNTIFCECDKDIYNMIEKFTI